MKPNTSKEKKKERRLAGGHGVTKRQRKKVIDSVEHSLEKDQRRGVSIQGLATDAKATPSISQVQLAIIICNCSERNQLGTSSSLSMFDGPSCCTVYVVEVKRIYAICTSVCGGCLSALFLFYSRRRINSIPWISTRDRCLIRRKQGKKRAFSPALKARRD